MKRRTTKNDLTKFMEEVAKDSEAAGQTEEFKAYGKYYSRKLTKDDEKLLSKTPKPLKIKFPVAIKEAEAGVNMSHNFKSWEQPCKCQGQNVPPTTTPKQKWVVMKPWRVYEGGPGVDNLVFDTLEYAQSFADEETKCNGIEFEVLPYREQERYDPEAAKAECEAWLKEADKKLLSENDFFFLLNLARLMKPYRTCGGHLEPETETWLYDALRMWELKSDILIVAKAILRNETLDCEAFKVVMGAV